MMCNCKKLHILLKMLIEGHVVILQITFNINSFLVVYDYFSMRAYYIPCLTIFN